MPQKTFWDAVGDVEALTDEEMLDKNLAKFLYCMYST